MRRLICLLALLATVTVIMSDDDFERFIALGCRWAHCGPGTLLERVEKARTLVAPNAHITVLLDDPAKDDWVDADGVRP